MFLRIALSFLRAPCGRRWAALLAANPRAAKRRRWAVLSVAIAAIYGLPWLYFRYGRIRREKLYVDPFMDCLGSTLGMEELDGRSCMSIHLWTALALR